MSRFSKINLQQPGNYRIISVPKLPSVIRHGELRRYDNGDQDRLIHCYSGCYSDISILAIACPTSTIESSSARISTRVPDTSDS